MALSPLGLGGEPQAFRLPDAGVDLEALERSLTEQALQRTGWNVTAAAKMLGLGRDALCYRVEKLGLDKSG